MSLSRGPLPLPVFHRANAFQLTETLGEVTGGGKTQHVGDLGQGVIGVRQQVAALLDAPSDQIIDGHTPYSLLKEWTR